MNWLEYKSNINPPKQGDTSMSENKKEKTIVVKETLKQLFETISSGNIPKAEEAWHGHDECIILKGSPKDKGSIYSEPSYVETDYPLELSWVFFQLKDAFYAEKVIDHFSKLEFFGRLADTAIRAIKEKPEISCQDLCRAVALEAESFYNKWERSHG